MNGTWNPKSRLALLIAGASLSMACANGTTAAFGGVAAPVLLGPCDRIGCPAAAKTAKVDDFATKALYLHTESSDGVYNYSQTTKSRAGVQAKAANDATHGDSTLDIRITELEADAYAGALGSTKLEAVRITGDVVKPEGAQ